MAYHPAEGNNFYDEKDLEREYELAAKGPKAKTPEERLAIKEQFLTLLAEGANVSKALMVINGTDRWYAGKNGRIGRKTIYSWRKYEEDFRRKWDEAVAIGNDRLEQRLEEYAYDEDPRLIERVLKYRNPPRYAVQRAEITGPEGGPMQVEQIEIVAAVVTDPGNDESST